MEETQTTGCCPRFDPEPWDNKTFEWMNKKFIKGKVFSILYMPMNIGSVMAHLQQQVEEAQAKMLDYMCLSDHTSMWNIDEYIAVDKEVPGAENVTISGTFLSKVYEGNFKDTGIWCKDFEKEATEKGYKVKKWYMWYTTCPECAKKYGKNYVVVVGQVEKA